MLELTKQKSIELTLIDIWAVLDEARADQLRVQHAMRSITHIHTFISSLSDCIHHKKRNAYDRLLMDLFFLFQLLLEHSERIVHEMDTTVRIYEGDDK